jgi:glycosyltransferase involved in cell wall biosynthesis
MLADVLGPDMAHTVIAIDGDYAARAIVPASARVAYAAAPTAESLTARIMAYRNYLRVFRPDILITYNWGAIEWSLANLLLRIPHIHMEDGFGPDEVRRQLRRRAWARRILLRRSTLVVPSATLGDIATSIWKIDSRRLRHIPNGIVPQTRRNTTAADLDLPGHMPRIVWAGALRPEKNPARLLRAFAPLRGEASLLILGCGPEQPRMMAEAERLSLMPSVHFLGQRGDARDIIMQCDIMALSSDTEQMPFAILEGMDAGLAIASVDVGDVRRMVAAENRRFVVPPDDDALSAALQQLVSDRVLRTAIGRANRKRVRECYHVQTMAADYAALFKGVARMQAGGHYHA